MQIVGVGVCFIGLVIVGEVSCFWGSNEEVDVFDSRAVEEEPSDEDYPYFVSLDFGRDGGVNTEENEVETGERKPKPDFESNPSAVDQPSNVDFGPLPDPFEPPGLDVTWITEKFEKLTSDLKAQQDRIAELEDTNKRLILKIDSIEQHVKINNIILTNVRQNTNESSKTTLQKVLHVLNRVMRVRTSASDIAAALRFESNSSTDGNRPIVVRFTNFATKMRVLAAANRLSSTGMGVTSDYSELVAQVRAALVPYLQQARAEGRRAFLLYDRLVVDGVKLTLEDLRAREETERASEKDDQVEMLDR